MEEARSLSFGITISTAIAQAEEDINYLMGMLGRLRAEAAGDVGINADTEQASENIHDLTNDIGRLQSGTGSADIVVDADTEPAEENVRELTGSIGSLGERSADIDIDVNTEQAQTDVQSLEDRVTNFGHDPPDIDIDVDTDEAKRNIRDLTDDIGNLEDDVGDIGTAFRKSFLAGIDSGNSFSSSLRTGVGGAITQIGEKVTDFKDNVVTKIGDVKESVVSGAKSIKEGFTHPIETIKNGLGGAIDHAKSRFTDFVRGADDAADAADDVGDAAGDARPEVEDLGDAAETSGSKFEKFGGILSGIGKAAGVALGAATTAVGTFAAASVKAGSEYESAFAQVETIMDTSKMSAEDMSSSIKALSSEMGISASDLSSTVCNAISATGDTANAVGLAEQASKLATAGFTDTSSALSVLTTAMNAYGLSADEVSGISDSLIQVQNLGVTTVAELSANMGKAIASASAYGVDLTNLESAYVSITKAGINTAEGTTYISSMMKELGDTGSDVAGILREKTGKGFDQLMSEGKSLGDLLGILSDSVDGDSTALMNLWSSAEAGKASAAIIGQGLDTFNENLKAIGESAEATESAYGIMADTLEHKTAVFKAAGENLLSSIYDGISGKLGELMDFANESMGQLADAFEEGGVPALTGALGGILSSLPVLAGAANEGRDEGY